MGILRLGVLRLTRCPFRNLVRIAVALPFVGFVFCVVWALYTDPSAATKTHCNVDNYLPSVSAAIGGFPLSQFVWKVCISLHAGPRFAIAAMYFRYLVSIMPRDSTFYSGFICSLNVIENIGLIGLTFVSSSDNYAIHANFFGLFVLCSTFYMILLCGALKFHRSIPPTELESKSLRCKIYLVFNYLLFIILCAYAFIRHNNRCETGMYTLFALFEYVVILSNMGFHMTAYWDFYDRSLPIDHHLLQRLI